MQENANDRRIAPETASDAKRSAAVTSRRRFVLGGTAGAAAWALRLKDGGWAPQPPVETHAPTTPDDALTRLMDGNRRYVSRHLKSCEEDLAAERQATVAKQEPFAAVLSCADSRVPVELIFDEGIGRLFVARVAGNVAATAVIASLEY